MLHAKSSTRAVEEAAVRRAGADPGSVEHVEGRALVDTRPLTAEEAAGLAAALATTLAEMHDVGVAHGRVDAGHVVLADDGRPVLSSPGPGGEPADDVAALGRLITGMLAARPPEPPALRGWRHRRRRLGPMLAPPAAPALAALATEAAARDRARRPSARALAIAISQYVPSACLPRPQAMPLAGPGIGARAPTRRWPRLRPLTVPAAVSSTVMAVVVAILVMARWMDSDRAPSRQPPPTAGQASGTPFAVGAHAGSSDFTDGVLTFDGVRYRVGQAGDAVAIGDWACSGRPTAVILRPSSGELFGFDDWAEPGHDVTARPLGRVEHATGVRAAPIAGSGCHELEVLRSQGAPERRDVTR